MAQTVHAETSSEKSLAAAVLSILLVSIFVLAIYKQSIYFPVLYSIYCIPGVIAVIFAHRTFLNRIGHHALISSCAYMIFVFLSPIFMIKYITYSNISHVQSYEKDGVTLIEAGKITPNGYVDLLGDIGMMAFLGVVGGILFWLLYFRYEMSKK